MAESTGGKTTLLETLLENTDRVTILNDEKNVITPSLGGNEPDLLSSTPWHGSMGYCHNMTVPLEAVIFINKDCPNQIEQVSVMEALENTLKTCIWPAYDLELLNPYMDRLLEFLERRKDSLYKLSYKKGTDVFSLIKEIHPC